MPPPPLWSLEMLRTSQLSMREDGMILYEYLVGGLKHFYFSIYLE